MKLTADLETTTDVNDCRVWAWGVCEVGNPDYFQHGNTIESLFEYFESVSGSTVYFHNERFDGEFLISWMLQNGYKHVVKNPKPPPREGTVAYKRWERIKDSFTSSTTDREDTKTFTTLISDTGQFYSIKIIFEKKGKRTKYIKILDSLKIIPFSIDEIAKAFGLPNKKLKIDYTEYRAPGHQLTPHELAYLYNDVAIAAGALDILFGQGLTKMTQASNALNDYKQTVGKDSFERWFSPLSPLQDRDIRSAYKGGYTYANPPYRNRDILRGLVLDVNSLYPWVLHDCPLPYDKPVYFNGKYKPDKQYNLYVQRFVCHFNLKPGHVPMVQIKGNFRFGQSEYLISSDTEYDDSPVCLTMTNVDLELFFDHYDVDIVEWDSGWKFKSTVGLFTEYIDKWMNVKIEASRTGNKAMRTLAKLMLNALYGKFGTALTGASKFPYLHEGVVRFMDGPEEIRTNPLYVPVAAFVTAWARNKTVRSAQMVYPYYAYSDTDSLHLNIDLPDEIMSMAEDELENLTSETLRKYGVQLPEGFDVDPVALGAWKVESVFHRARFIRQKTYLEDANPPELWNAPPFSSKAHKEFCEDMGITDDMKKYAHMFDHDKMNVVCAGMPKSCHACVTWENFHEGQSYQGKKQPKHVQGGIVLVPTVYTIQKS